MNHTQTILSPALRQAGLNCHAVFDIASITPEARERLIEACPTAANYRQLILIAHGGTAFWQALKASNLDLAGSDDAHPVDDFTVSIIEQFLHAEFAGVAYQIVYPCNEASNNAINLQELGDLAGWHHPSPFMVGINASFGSWFAYRAVVLANTDLPATLPVHTASPCDQCADKPCINSCPAHALDDGQFNLLKCIGYRQQPDSACKATCAARSSCPVGREHRYSDEQMRYHYGCSMRAIVAANKR